MMSEMQKIYETWTMAQADSPQTIKKWCSIEEYLYQNCPDPVREQIEDYIMEYGKQLEHTAFIDGYQKAFSLWIEILSSIG